MIVASDTSPLTNLAAIGHFDLLCGLFASLVIPPGVWAELNARDVPWPGSLEVQAAAWVTIRSPSNLTLVSALRRDLDLGESETLALALELRADLVLLDERDGRHAAQRLGLRPMGTVGVLIEAKRRHLLPALRPALDALKYQAGFYLADAVRHRALAAVGEAQ